MEPDKILIDIRTCELTLSQFVAEAYRYIELMPDHEIFMDGDADALVARRRQGIRIWMQTVPPSRPLYRTTYQQPKQT